MKKINVLYQVILFVCGICLFLFFPLVQGDRSTGAELLEDRGNYWDMLTSSFKIGLVLFNYASTIHNGMARPIRRRMDPTYLFSRIHPANKTEEP